MRWQEASRPDSFNGPQFTPSDVRRQIFSNGFVSLDHQPRREVSNVVKTGLIGHFIGH